MKVEIIILNYNRKDLLAEYLPSMVEAAARSRDRCRVTLLDNKSTDESIDYVSRIFPQVKIFNASQNRVLCSFNEAAADSDADILILMNNDIKADENFIGPLVEHYNDERVFYVAPKVLNLDGTFNGGRSYLKMEYGIIKVNLEADKADEPGTTQTIACGAFRRSIFMELGGYDDIYLPGYWEDTDLCYRALKRGYKGIYEPRSRIYHQEEATFSQKYSQHEKMVLVDRNMFLFTWKNISNRQLLTRHVVFLIPRLIYALISGRLHMLAGFLKALKKLPEIRNREMPEPKTGCLNDREIIKL